LWPTSTTNRVFRYDSIAALANDSSPVGVFGQDNFTSDLPGWQMNRLDYLQGVFVDALGTLWVADSSNSRVLFWHNASYCLNGSFADGYFGSPFIPSEIW